MSHFHGGVLQKIYGEVASNMADAGVEKFTREHGRKPYGPEVYDIEQTIVEKTEIVLDILQNAAHVQDDDSIDVVADKLAAAGKKIRAMASELEPYTGAIFDATVDSAIRQVRAWPSPM